MKAEERMASRSLREAGDVWRVAPRTEGTQQSEAGPLVALALIRPACSCLQGNQELLRLCGRLKRCTRISEPSLILEQLTDEPMPAQGSQAATSDCLAWFSG